MVELLPHQQKAVDELHNGAILWGDVGSGKTITAAAFYMEKYAKYGDDLDVIVITTAKKRDSLDWETDFAKFGIGKTRDSSVAGALTVDSWNNITKYDKIKDAFFIFDEQRVVGSGEWVKSFIRIAKQNRWIMLSATPGDTWLDYVPVFIANGFFKHRTEFIENHVVYNRFAKFPKVDRYMNVGRLVKYKNQVLVEMKFMRHTTRNTTTITVEHDQEAFRRVLEDRWNLYSNRPLRDVAELFSVLRKVVNSSPTRLEVIRTLMLKHPKLIVFYNFDYELELLRSLASTTLRENLLEIERSGESCDALKTTVLELSETDNVIAAETRSMVEPIRKLVGTTSSRMTTKGSTLGTELSSASAVVHPFPKTSTSKNITNSTSITTAGFQVAEWNGHKHEPIPDGDRWIYLVQYQAGAEGWNCISTDAMVFYSLTYSYKLWHQAHGRIDRLNTPFSILNYYVLMSNSMIDKAIMRSLRSKKSFNEKRWLNGK